MKYCSQHDLFEACQTHAIHSWAKDNPQDTPELITQRIDSAIQRASDEVSLFIGKICSLPLDTIPPVLRDICVKLALYQLLSRHGLAEGSQDSVIRTNRNSALRKLDLIAHGKLLIFDTHSSQTKSILTSFPSSPYKGGW